MNAKFRDSAYSRGAAYLPSAYMLYQDGVHRRVLI